MHQQASMGWGATLDRDEEEEIAHCIRSLGYVSSVQSRPNFTNYMCVYMSACVCIHIICVRVCVPECVHVHACACMYMLIVHTNVSTGCVCVCMYMQVFPRK